MVNAGLVSCAHGLKEFGDGLIDVEGNFLFFGACFDVPRQGVPFWWDGVLGEAVDHAVLVQSHKIAEEVLPIGLRFISLLCHVSSIGDLWLKVGACNVRMAPTYYGRATDVMQMCVFGVGDHLDQRHDYCALTVVIWM